MYMSGSLHNTSRKCAYITNSVSPGSGCQSSSNTLATERLLQDKANMTYSLQDDFENFYSL